MMALNKKEMIMKYCKLKNNLVHIIHSINNFDIYLVPDNCEDKWQDLEISECNKVSYSDIVYFHDDLEFLKSFNVLRFDFMTIEKLIEIINTIGIDKIQFIETFNNEKRICKITEDRYIVNNNYKISILSIDGKDIKHFYIFDLAKLIEKEYIYIVTN